VTKSPKPKTVLVIDDDTFLRQMIETMLALWGYNVVTAINGEHGLEMFRQFQPDLVITDLVMPVMDGGEFIREAHRIDPSAHVIAMSAMVERTAWGFCRAAAVTGADATIGKPFYPAELQSIIGRLLSPAV
jgi:two-component system, chemotaxis family, chemotaxis protein CheY